MVILKDLRSARPSSTPTSGTTTSLHYHPILHFIVGRTFEIFKYPLELSCKSLDDVCTTRFAAAVVSAQIQAWAIRLPLRVADGKIHHSTILKVVSLAN
jgi:hypothetical protein